MGCDVDSGEDRVIPKNLVSNKKLAIYNLRYNANYDHYEYCRNGIWSYIFCDHITDVSQITDLIYKAGYNNAVGTIRQSMNTFYKQ